MKRKELNELWNLVKENVLIDNNERRQNLLTLLDGSRIEEISEDNGSIIISLMQSFSRTIIAAEFKNDLLEIISSTFNSDYDLDFVIKEEWEKRKSNSISDTEEMKVSVKKSDSLNSDFTIDNFIVSADGENKMIKQAALSVSLKPNEWNPFFIYGGSGLGKTHLLHAIGNKMFETFPNLTVKYLESKDFKDLIYDSGVNTQNIKQINKDLLKYDVLLIDDIQMIQSLPKAKEVFFGIFSNFITSKKQIVLTSDVYPEEMKDFEERFITRFKGGILMGVNPPDKKTAKKIFLQKIKKGNGNEVKLTDEALDFVAINFSSNVRELEGALNKIIFWSITHGIKSKYNLEDVMNIFDGLATNQGISMKSIVSIISKNYQVSTNDILSKSRKAEITLPRHISIYFSKKLLDASLIDIGKYFKRDHSTILSSIKKIEKEIKVNKELEKAIYDLGKKIKSSV